VGAIRTSEELRERYRAPGERALRKQLDRLDAHCRRFVELSPFLVLATTGPDGLADATPRGGDPGFVQVADERTLLMPDRPGNNRIDSLTNLAANPGVGLLFLIPGVDETLRVNGTAELRDDDELRGRFDREGRLPATVVVVSDRDAYLHCAKALMRSRLSDHEARNDRAELPTLGEMLRDQLGTTEPPETREQMVERYREQLY
jgi:PPOX class probable FMN-dependent enzyme